MYDIAGDGRIRLNASYSRYVNRIAETIGGAASPAGNPAAFYYFYDGPTISGLPTFEAFAQMFAWFDSVGGLGTDDYLVDADIPGLNLQIRESLVSPSLDEFTVGAGFQIGTSGFFRADYIHRDWNDFFVTFANRDIGKVVAESGEFDLKLIENTNELTREYDAVQLQLAYRLFQRLNLGAVRSPTRPRRRSPIRSSSSSRSSIPPASCRRTRRTRSAPGSRGISRRRSGCSTSASCSASIPARRTRRSAPSIRPSTSIRQSSMPMPRLPPASTTSSASGANSGGMT